MKPRIVISGGSGLIGSALTTALHERGYDITQLVRRSPTSEDEVQWNPGAAPLDPMILDGATAVIALGGASVRRLRSEERRVGKECSAGAGPLLERAQM